MEWEQVLQAALGLSKDQMRFMLALFSSLLVGAGIRMFKSPTVRHMYALITGVLLTYYPFGSGVFHALPPAIITYLAMVVAPKKAGVVAWWASFPYLIYLHVVNASGMSWTLGQMDFTGCEMVLVLKLVSIAVSTQDYHSKKKEELTPFQATHAIAQVPNPLEFFSYVFSLGNLLAGPYFEFRNYKEFIESRGVWDPRAEKPAPSVVLPSLWCLGEAFLFMGLYLKMVPIFNVGTFTQPWFLKSPALKRAVIIFVTGMTNQYKYCFSWKLSETSMTLAGLDFDRWDLKTGKAVWGRCCNVRWFHLQCTDSATLVPTAWNICTGNFLRRYVYERLAPKGRKPGFLELLMTQMTSAVWHGLYAGYMLFFAGSAVWIYFSKLVHKAEMKFMPGMAKTLPWHVVKAVWTNFVLNYMASAFMVLELKGSLDVYASIAYIPFIIMFAGVLVAPFMLGGKKPKLTTKTE